MLTYSQYWTGASVLAALALIVPVWLIVDGKLLGAAIIGVTTIIFLSCFIGISMRWFHED
jgi:O-antigen/teichoic acid export membrane protein